MSRHRVVFLGQKPFGEVAWQSLMKVNGGPLEVVAVCSNASADTVWWGSNAIFTNRGKIPFIDNGARNNQLIRQAIEQGNANLILSVQHPWILPREILAGVNYKAINFHNAKLPKYKGYNAVNHAILNDDDQFTCTAHWMNERVDAGDFALESIFDISPRETAMSLYCKSYVAGLALFDAVLERLVNEIPLERRPIIGNGQFYPRNSINGLREINNMEFVEVDKKARAFFFPPFEPAYLIRGENKYYVLPEEVRGYLDLVEGSAKQIFAETVRSVEDKVAYRIG